jgi:hypothetical protein
VPDVLALVKKLMAPTGVLQSPIFFAYGGEEFRRIRPIEGGSEGWGCIVIDGVVLPRGEALVKNRRLALGGRRDLPGLHEKQSARPHNQERRQNRQPEAP